MLPKRDQLRIRGYRQIYTSWKDLTEFVLILSPKPINKYNK